MKNDERTGGKLLGGVVPAVFDRLDRATPAASAGPVAHGRQPVHVVYGGAHLFRADTPRKLGAAALRALDEHAPDPSSFARVMGFDASAGEGLAEAVLQRVRAKLRDEPVEDYRIDFEDGYGVRGDAEEDEHAEAAGAALGRAYREGLAPPFAGVRVKALEASTRARAARTLEIFVASLARALDAPWPEGFVVTLPKVSSPAEVEALATLLGALEAGLGLRDGALSIELMIELPAAVVDATGRLAPRGLVDAAGGRCVAAHFGTYDYTAAIGLTPAGQRHDHPAADLARQLMQISLAGTGVRLADGATTLLPVGPHRAPEGGALTAAQRDENAVAVRRGLRLHRENVTRSLAHGLYQGWDLHPAQLPARFAAVHAFFLEGVDAVAARLTHFVERAARATRVGATFDDAATGQGLLNFFLTAASVGAMTEAEACKRAGLTLDELRARSFARMVMARQ